MAKGQRLVITLVVVSAAESQRPSNSLNINIYLPQTQEPVSVLNFQHFYSRLCDRKFRKIVTKVKT